MDAEQYVDRLVEAERDEMVQRVRWISDHRPQFSAGIGIFGGEEAAVLYEDAQISYIHGTFSGAIILGQSFIERSVCGYAYSAGEFAEDDRPGYHDAVNFLKENNILLPEEVEGINLSELHNLRNPLVHYRNPTDESTLLGRKIERIRENPETKVPTTPEMLQEDAKQVLKTCFSVVKLFGVGESLH